MTTTPEQSDEGRQRGLDRNLVAGLAWTGAAKWGSQLLTWSATILVARLLSPTDYGIIGIATLYLGLVQMVSEFGLGSAIVQNRSLDHSAIARLGGLSIAIGAGLLVVSIAAAPLVGGFFDSDASARVIAVMSVSFLITAVQVVPLSLLARDLNFRGLAAVDASAAVAQASLTLFLAWAGASYWSLAVGGIAGKTFATAIAWKLRPHSVAAPRRLQQLTSSLKFGWRVVLSRLSWYVYSNADFAVIGKVMGSAALGAYTFGWTLASMPVDKVTAVVSRVAMPVLSAVQNQPREFSRYLLLLSEGLVLITLPAGLGLAMVAPDLISVALGDRWAGAAAPLQILALHVPFRCLLSPYAQALLALDETQQSVKVGIVQLLVMPAAFVVGAKYGGLTGVAAAWLVIHPLITVPILLVYTLRRVGLRLRDLIVCLAPSVASALAMCLFTLLAIWSLRDSAPLTRLAISVLVGALSYAGALFALHRRRLRDLLERLKEMRNRPSVPSAESQPLLALELNQQDGN